MDLKEPQIKIDAKEPFKNCKLNRKQYADALENIVSNTPDGCVIALNGAWGTGKTTFVRMWEQQLKNDGYKTAYFNAWETDFVSDPLVALIGELGRVVKEGDKNKNLKKVKEILVSRFLFRSLPKFASGALRLAGFENVTDGGQEIIDGIKLLFEKELGDYEIECKEFDELRKSLSALVGDIDPQKPLVFFIDELDRCNPHYAVRILERVKHLFSLSRIVFVLCIDKEQLGHSICGYYGSDKINAQEYLRRFIDIDYYLPEPDYDMFVKFLRSESVLDKLVSRSQTGWKGDTSPQDQFNVVKWLFEARGLSLRQMNKTLNYISLIVKTFTKIEMVPIDLLAILVYLRQFQIETYQKIRYGEYNIQELVNAIEKSLPESLFQINSENDEVASVMTFVVARLIDAYTFKDFEQNRMEIYVEKAPNDIELLFQLSVIKEEKMKKAFIYGRGVWSGREDILPNTIKHIEMLYEPQPEAR